MALKDMLRRARENKGLSQTDVERLCGIKRTALSNYENGVSEPDVDKLKVLCDLYGITPNDLFEWENDNSPALDHEIKTIAAHHNGKEWSESELDEIERFKEWVRSKRK